MTVLSRKATRWTIAAWLVTTASISLAQSSVSMGDIQNAANRGGDKSMSALELVYGSVVHNPLVSGGGAGGGMIAQLFMVLNSCMLAVGVIWGDVSLWFGDDRDRAGW